MICNNDVWSSKDGAEWSLVKPNTFKDASFDRASDWEGRHTAGYVVYKDKMWVIGGQNLPQFGGGDEDYFYQDAWTSTDGVE
jgi:hypothetical protein